MNHQVGGGVSAGCFASAAINIVSNWSITTNLGHHRSIYGTSWRAKRFNVSDGCGTVGGAKSPQQHRLKFVTSRHIAPHTSACRVHSSICPHSLLHVCCLSGPTKMWLLFQAPEGVLQAAPEGFSVRRAFSINLRKAFQVSSCGRGRVYSTEAATLLRTRRSCT